MVAETPGGRLLVAVIDDEECVRRSVERLLRSAGMDVRTFDSGAEFLRVSPSAFDCLVLDLHMPVMGGFDIHEHCVREGIRLPVVIVTGHDTPENRSRAISSGVAGYLAKPIDDTVLLGAIVAAVQGSSSLGAAR